MGSLGGQPRVPTVPSTPKATMPSLAEHGRANHARRRDDVVSFRDRVRRGLGIRRALDEVDDGGKRAVRPQVGDGHGLDIVVRPVGYAAKAEDQGWKLEREGVVGGRLATVCMLFQ